MDTVKKFLEESPMAEAVSLPAAVIIHRQKLSPKAVGGIMDKAVYVPSGEDACELEVGGRVVARGKIIRRRSGCWFKVTETAKGGEA